MRSRIRFILRGYDPHHSPALEQEAFVIQSQPDAEALLIAALNQRCTP